MHRSATVIAALACVVCLGGSSVTRAADAAASRPNILLIVSDDHAHDALGCAGNAVIQTPHLDRLAADGVRFTHAFSPHPICMTSRACILTGQDSWTNGSADFNVTPQIDPESPLWPRLLAEAGYETFYTGKWHNDGLPWERGFTAAADVWAGGGYDHAALPVLQQGQPRSARRPLDRFASTAFADATVRFLEDRPQDKPFAVMLSFTAPHDPWVPPPPYDTLYDMAAMPLPPNFMPRPPYKVPEHFSSQRDQQQLGWPRFPWAVRAALTQYYGMITQMDAEIGRVLDALDRLQLADDTLVIFVGDQGYSMGSHGFVGKQTMNEEGLRTPLIVRWSRLRRGRPTHDALVLLQDLSPTILAAAGVPVPDAVEGRGLLGYYQGHDEPRRAHICAGFSSRLQPSYHQIPTRCIRTERHKYIQHLLTGEVELFDLQTDPHELTNLAGHPDHAAIQRELHETLMDWRAEYEDR